MSRLSFEGELLHQDLLSNGYAVIEHSIPLYVIDEFVAAHAEFTDNLPNPDTETMARMIIDTGNLDTLNFSQDTQKQWHKYRTNYPRFDKPGGHTDRSFQATVLRELGHDQADDPKEYYHVHIDGLDRIREQHERYNWGPVPPEVEKLQKQGALLHGLARIAVEKTLTLVEEKHPGLSRLITRADLQNSPMRSLRYHPGQTEVLAEGHYDKGSTTLQLADSHPGLRIRNLATGQMELVHTKAHESPFFVSGMWRHENAFPDSDLSPGWHDVIDTDTGLLTGRTLPGSNIARWAIIFFVSCKNIGVVTDKKSTHQESSELVA